MKTEMRDNGEARNKPMSDLMYDWITVLQSKAEGVNAYEKYIADAEEQNSDDCVELLTRLRDKDAQMLQEVQAHVAKMMTMMPGDQGAESRMGADEASARGNRPSMTPSQPLQ